MSAFGGKADLNQGLAECPLIAKSGHSGDGKKPGVFPERATKDSSFPHRPPVANRPGNFFRTAPAWTACFAISAALNWPSIRIDPAHWVLAVRRKKEYVPSARRCLNSPCRNGFQAPIDRTGLMFRRTLVKSGLFCGFRSLKESSGKAISRLVPPPAFKQYPLCFRENGRHAFSRAVAGVPLRIHTGPLTGGC